ncbi:GRAS family protein RAD1-like [Prosopis cineraria]|uniref:GRAS family protein RAD1-like n=1 Tax=Prosopis cineraria TaxID=364024 RepID=UPI0024105A8E|nr:GRAS family protein RAD1-like [Prosopis cineraria]
MAPPYRALTGHLSDNNDHNPMIGLGFYNSSVGCVAYPHLLPVFETRTSPPPWTLPFSDKTNGNNKRLKKSPSIPEVLGDYRSISSSSGSEDCYSSLSRSNSVISLPKLHFRDHIWTITQRYLASEEAAQKDMTYPEATEAEERDGNCADGMRLVQLLVHCAEGVACRDKSHSSILLSELRSNALVFGSPFQRVASCFVQGLADRLAMVESIGAVGNMEPMMNIMDIASEETEEALKLVFEICPHIKFGHFVANATILEAFDNHSFVHVVDLGMTLGLPHGHQWRGLIQSLANRPGQPIRHLRITGVGLCVEKLKLIGEELELYAHNLGINLEFSVVGKNLEKLQIDDIKVNDEEVVVVNSILQLHCVVKESRGALNSVLQMIHKLSPKVLVMVEQDSSHNGPFFLGRFMEALHYYSAIFDSLDAMLPKYDTKRAKIEQFYFAEEIKNIVSCEGPARVERHERLDQWRRRMSRAGFQGAPVKMVSQAKQWLQKNQVCDGYTVVEEKGCLVLGWQSKPIVAASCWKC